MFLKTREIPAVHFRENLPASLEPLGQAFVEIDARPAGMANQAYMAALDQAMTAKTVRDMRANRLADEVDKIVALQASEDAFGRDIFGAIYDTCVIAWRSNLIDAAMDAPIETTRATFMDLIEVPIPEVRAMMRRFQTDLLQAGADAAEADAATIKN